ncbi:ectoine/hydroxyectoine ABC transporter substrate-binding protein EhuB [Yinghuangia sp. ASG 101]|uniref:ectoine/hydroxyectoine ABC transporter substrate-binding protein EhuB n=1 Tax=Yinghuangia sp. ASG 101 TaxID=2896848 RepID=UPI001E374B16|nr:ectoine/hydroxyectoine ABC transporter substrate-binding protein EhuB [Yinghuangia sp. ASG 101]UGQ12818.1 ectoine/hydroxyectoine ABC transporter substrate-binding protein EhuB [Yinghuangia sp. ASG 101]
MDAIDERDRAGAGVPRRAFLGVALGGVVGAVAATTGCSRVDLTGEPNGGSLLSRLRDRGSVRIGFANEAPYSYLDKNAKLTGEAAAVAKVVFGRLGVPKIDPVPADFGALIAGLRAGLFDVVGAGMSITPSRCKAVLFTDPEFNASEAFLVPRGNPAGLMTMEDVARTNVRLGVLLGAVELDVALKSGVPESRIVRFADQPSAFDGIAGGRVDAVSLTSISLRWGLKQRPHLNLEVTPPYRPVIDGQEFIAAAGAFAVRPDQSKFVAAFNTQLHGLRDSGELLALQSPFGFTESDVPAPELTAEKVCQG